MGRNKEMNVNLANELIEKTQQVIAEMEALNVIVVGKTGVGKSTLINSLFRDQLAETGIGQPITQHVKKISKEHIPLVLYDTKGWELSEQSQQEVKKEIKQLLKQKKQEQDPIHVMYYCIHATGARIEETEIEFIKEWSKEVRIIIVLTQSLGTPADEFRAYIESLRLPVEGIMNVLARPYPIYEQVALPIFGLVELLERTEQIVPKEVQAALMNAQQVDIARKAKHARKWVQKYLVTTFGVGFSPIPFSDAAILVPMQVTMMAHITAIFGVEMDKKQWLMLVSVVGGTSGTTALGKWTSSNVLKLIPGAGTVLGGVISGTIASILTAALGMSYIEILTLMLKKEQANQPFTMEQMKELWQKKIQERLRFGMKRSEKSLSSRSSADEVDEVHLSTVKTLGKVTVGERVHKTKHVLKGFTNEKSRSIQQFWNPLSQNVVQSIRQVKERFFKKDE